MDCQVAAQRLVIDALVLMNANTPAQVSSEVTALLINEQWDMWISSISAFLARE